MRPAPPFSEGTAPAGAGRQPELPKVAFIVSQFPETHETFILRELAALESEGLDFVIFSLKPCRDKVVQNEARMLLGRTYYPRDAGRGGRLAACAAASLRAHSSLPWATRPLECAYVAWACGRFSALASDLGVGHIHAHWATAPTSAAVILSRALGIQYSLTAHAWDIYAGDGRIARKVHGALFAVTCTEANAEYLRSLLPRQDWGKLAVNYHGVPEALRTAGPRLNGTLKIAAVGRLVETKGFSFLIDALRGCEFPFELTIVGDGPLRGRLEAQAGRLGLSSGILFSGTIPVEEVFDALSRSHVFVMPSVIAANGDRDGIPNVLLEAMSTGLPVIASRVSGIPEAVVDGSTGFLVPEKDPVALAAALRTVRDNPEVAAEMGARGRARVLSVFSAERNARALFEIFRKCLGGRTS